ncbi:MAG: hypothetical protein M3495_04945, partial [Pseudomonadota bacterium]|nr:hypothetical protein [Pseudomonadota bacterium]
MRETRDEFIRGGFGALVFVQHLGEEADLVKETVFVLRILLLRDLILLQRLLRLHEKTEAVAEIGPHVGVVGPERNRFFVVLDRVLPVLPVVIPVSQGAGSVGRGELRRCAQSGEGERYPAGREKAFDDGLGRIVSRATHDEPNCSRAEGEGEEKKDRPRPGGWLGRGLRFSTLLCHDDRSGDGTELLEFCLRVFDTLPAAATLFTMPGSAHVSCAGRAVPA